VLGKVACFRNSWPAGVTVLLLDPYVNAGMVDSVKFSRKSLVAGEEDCACVSIV